MRVAIFSHGVYPELTGGMERHTFALTKHLRSAGLDAELLVPPAAAQAEFPFPVHRIPWPSRPVWLWSNHAFSALAANWIDREHPDIAFGQGFALWAYLSRRKIPTVFHPHGLEMFGRHLRGTERLMTVPFRALVRYHGRLADATVSLGGGLTAILRDEANILKERIFEAPNAVDPEEFPFVRDARPEGSLLFVGRLAFNKGIDLLAKAFSLLKREKWSLTIVGEGPERHHVEGLVRRFPHVRFLGSADDTTLRREYARHECLLFTSRFEGMPTVILEAMASGCAVIGTRIGAVESVITPETGLLVEPSFNSIAEGIRSFLDRTGQARRSLGEAGRARVEAEFSWKRVTPRYLRLFENLRRERGNG